jgi:predicted RNA methylase
MPFRMASMKVWSDTEYVYRCLADRERTLAFKAAIEKAVKPGNVVLDLGTGSGIMAIFAAKAGARKVYAVEIADYLSRVSRENFARSGYAETIVPLRMNARDVSVDKVEKPDVVICEMITTGLIGEMQGPVINSLKRSGVIDAQTIIIPNEISTSVTLAHADFTFYEVPLHFPIFIDYFTKSFENHPAELSERKMAHSVHFSSDFSEEVQINESLQASTAGVVNGLLLTSETGFVGGTEIGACISYCQPLILPIKEMRVSTGDTVSVSIRYRMGEGFDSLSYKVEANCKK